MLYRISLLLIYLICTSLYLLIPNPWSSSSSFSPLVTMSLFSMSACVSISSIECWKEVIMVTMAKQNRFSFFRLQEDWKLSVWGCCCAPVPPSHTLSSQHSPCLWWWGGREREKYRNHGPVQFSSVQRLSHVWLFAISWSAACQDFLCITNSQSLLKLMSIESSDAI